MKAGSGRSRTGWQGIVAIPYRFHRLSWLVLLLAWPFALTANVPARPGDLPALCESAAREAARLTGVPAEVLLAIALAETGRRIPGGRQLRPWPWTVNQGGDGRWFATREEALAHAGAALDAGGRNIDLGCFQLNHRWHAGGFPSLEAMLDPAANALYAARFLRRLHEAQGDWSRAAGAYHSGTPEFALRYRTRFDTLLAGLAGPDSRFQPPPETVAALAPRQNNFPLLRAGAVGRGGSLVPLPGSGRRLIGGQP